MKLLGLHPEHVPFEVRHPAEEVEVRLVGLEPEHLHRVRRARLGLGCEAVVAGDLRDAVERRGVLVGLGLVRPHHPVRAVHAADDDDGRAGALQLGAPGGDLAVEDQLQLARNAELDLDFLALGEGRLALPLEVGIGDDDLEGAGPEPRLEDADADDRGGLFAL